MHISLHGVLATLLLVLVGVAHADSFNETLTLRPLAGGYVHTALSFEMHADNASLHHFGLLPRALLQPVASLGVRDMQLTLNKGRWRYDRWGSPAIAGATEGVASGAEVWASLAPGAASHVQRWRVLTSSLASLFCASLDGVDDKTTVAPLHNYFGASVAENDTLVHAYLPSEALCTENIAPLLQLLPCKGGAGLASLIRTHSVLRTDFHGVSVAVRHDDASGWRVTLEMQAVIAQGKLTLASLFGRAIERTCPLATESKVRLVGLVPDDEDDELQSEFDTASLLGHDLHVTGAHMAPLPPSPLVATRAVLGADQERNTVKLVLRNNLRSETLRVLYYDQVAPFVLPLLHTLRADAAVDAYDDGDEVVHYRDDVAEPHVLSMYYDPPVLRERTGMLELELRVPASSTLTVTYTLAKQMLHYEEHVPDPHRGRDLPPALFVPLGRGAGAPGGVRPWPVVAWSAPAQAQRIYTPPGLVDVAMPDFSMPYNVILFYSTYVALFFGNMLNLIMRTFRDIWTEVV